MHKFIKVIKSISALQKVVLLVSISLLILSFTQPAFYIDREDPDAWSDSIMLFFFGWTAFLGGAYIPFLIWLANPLYIVSVWFIIKKNSKGFYISILASLLAFSFSQLDDLRTSESGTYSEISSLELGYMLWLASYLVLTLGTGINQFLLKDLDAQDVS